MKFIKPKLININLIDILIEKWNVQFLKYLERYDVLNIFRTEYMICDRMLPSHLSPRQQYP